MGLRETFRENLKFYRKQAGLTQEKLSELSGCNQNYIAEIERSSSKFPKPETIDAIAKALNIRSSDLFLEKGCPRNVINFDSEKFTKEIIAELSEKLRSDMFEYFKKKINY
ncbi:MAG: helix-turn-helix transcriptional regulator [Treponema sp.]|nr:helix-turn-helix transcriptional regulator [Candidatus Treponema merdequi]